MFGFKRGRGLCVLLGEWWKDYRDSCESFLLKWSDSRSCLISREIEMDHEQIVPGVAVNNLRRPVTPGQFVQLKVEARAVSCGE